MSQLLATEARRHRGGKRQERERAVSGKDRVASKRETQTSPSACAFVSLVSLRASVSLWRSILKTCFYHGARLGTYPSAPLAGFIAAVSLTLLSCAEGGGSPAYGPNLSAISVSFSQAPPSPMLTSAQQMVAATVSNDSANMGVDWRVSCASTQCGSFNPAHTASGAPTTFTAPASVPPTDNRINITAVSTANPTATVTATVLLTEGISVTFVQPPPASLQEGGTASQRHGYQ